MDSDARPMLISLQVLSGKQPWSEIREDAAVVLSLAKAHKPGRPKSRTLNDSHWNLIQDCWSPTEERPAAEAIIPTIQQFVNSCPGAPPLCDLLRPWSSQADLEVESSPLSQTITEGSSNYFSRLPATRRLKQVCIDDYLSPVDYIDNSPSTPTRITSPSDSSSLDQPHKSEKRRTHITDTKATKVQSEFRRNERVTSPKDSACVAIHFTPCLFVG